MLRQVWVGAPAYTLGAAASGTVERDQGRAEGGLQKAGIYVASSPPPPPLGATAGRRGRWARSNPGPATVLTH